MRRLRIDDFLAYRFLSKLAYSPCGRNAAFVVSAADWEKNGYRSDMYLLDVGTEKITRLTASGDAKNFRWASDDEILFPAARDPRDRERIEKGELLTVFNRISASGGEAVEVCRVPLKVSDFEMISETQAALLCKWRPSDMNFAAMSKCERADAFEKIAEERDYEVLEEIPFWSNGEGFTSGRRNRLYVLDLATGETQPVTDELTDVLDFRVREGRILYCGRRYEGRMALESGAYAFDIASGRTETIYGQRDMRVTFVDVWKDRWLIRASDMKAYGMGEFGNFYLARDGKLDLFASMDEAAGAFTNSDCRYGEGTGLKVCGHAIYYTAVDHVRNALRRIDESGRVETLVEMDDTIDGFDIAGPGILYFGLGATTLHELFKLEGGKPRRVSNFNGELLAGVELNEPERCDAQGARDTIEGFVLKPVGFESGKKYPAILHIHGGPKTAFGNTYFHEMHYWSSLGYFVLFCNPWGSDGRGDRFADLRGQYGEVDYDDLMTFTDRCLAAYPQIDEARLAVTGGSYGGFMTNWIIGHTDRFRCAATQRSIANWLSKFGTTDIGYYFNADQMCATPWDQPEKAWYHSPVRYADKARTPTLIIHSEEDYRCWLAEGLQMFTALKYHGVDARLCMFRGENHELSRSGKPKHRVRRMVEIVNWFAKYCPEV